MCYDIVFSYKWQKSPYKNCNNCQKLSIIMMWNSAIGSASKISISHELDCWEESAFAGLLSLTGMGCFSEVFWEENIFLDIVSQKQITCDLCTSFACAKWRRPLGGSSWKLIELIGVSRFLAYVTRTHKWRMSVTCGKKLPWGKKCIHAYIWVTWQTNGFVMISVKSECSVGEGDNP